MLHSRRLLLLFAFCLTVLSLSQIVAQDETPNLTPQPTEIIIPTLPPTETATDLPSATPLPSFTPTPLPSETPTASETPTLSISESPTPTLTVDASLSPSPTITLTPSATSSASATESGLDIQAVPSTEVVATPSDPNDQPYNLSDNLDDPNLSNWAGDVRDRRTSKGGSQQLVLSSSQRPIFLNQGYLKDASVQLNLSVSKGIVWLTTNASEAGHYSVAFDVNGSVTLYRGQQLIGISIMSPFTENEMRTVNLKAVSGIITVAIAGKEIIRAVDTNPLPAGMISIRGGEGSFGTFALSAKIDTLQANSKSTKPIDSAQISKSSIQALAVTSPRIVFDSYDVNGTGDSDIFMVNPNGTGLMNLTMNAGYDQMPAWSPDGTQIAFISSRNGGAQIYIMDVATRSVTQLTTVTSKANPSWSPDGQWISYEQVDTLGYTQIYKINIANVNIIYPITSSPFNAQFGGFQANWSWGSGWGTSAALVFTGFFDAGLYQVDNSGANVFYLGVQGVEADYSKSGSRIAYRTGNGATTRIDSIGTGGEITIFNSPAFVPNWSPDGTQLVISKGSNNNADDLFIINMSGSIVNQVTSGSRLDSNPDWSDGVATTPTLTPIPSLTPTTSSYSCPCSLWTTSNTPVVSDSGNLAAVEVGVKFKSSVSGSVTAMRFYKDANNTGTHTGHLWTSTGTLLATVTFSGESASGWQTATFSNPVAISANTTYIISYHTPSGHFSYTLNNLTNAWVNGPLTALDSASSGGNGIYGIGGSGTFPTSDGGGANFWVDVIFATTTSPTLTPTPTRTLTPTLTPTPYACPCSLWTTSATPAVADYVEANPLELGVKFQASVNVTVTGLRFYKSSANTGTHTGHLWTSSGTLLATAVFTNETASGWQTVTFSTPVAITANTIYVASYHSSSAHFSYTANYFSAPWVSGPLTAPAHTTANPNGVFKTGASGTFPNVSSNNLNYWVDVIVVQGTPPTATPTHTLTPTITPTPTPSGGSFPSTGVLDTFNRANGAIGTNWSGVTGDFSINNNQLDVGTTNSSPGSIIYWNQTSFGADQEAYVTLSTIDSAADEINLYLKIQNNNWLNGVIEVWYHPSEGKVYISTYDNGWVTYGNGIPVTFTNGDRFGARATFDGTVEVYKNSTLVGSRIITPWSHYADSGKIGLKMVNASATLLDDFGGGTQGVCPTGFAAQASALGPGDNPCVQVTPTLTPTICYVSLIPQTVVQGYKTSTPNKTRELEDMQILSKDTAGNITGLKLSSAPVINAKLLPYPPIQWGTGPYQVSYRLEFTQGVNDKQIWYQVGTPGNVWIPVRYDGLDYSVGSDPCQFVGVPPSPITFTYDRERAANYAIEHSYDTAVNHSFLQNTEHRVTQALVRTPPLPYAYFRYVGLGTTNPITGQPITGSATFVSESQWMGGMPMTLGNLASCTSGTSLTDAGWRYCFDPSGTPPLGTSTDPWDTHGDLHTYWTGSSSTPVLPASSRGGIFTILGGQYPFVIVGRATTSSSTSLQTDLNLNLAAGQELILLGPGVVHDRSALSARVVSLLNQNQNSQQPPQPLRMGDYITMIRPVAADTDLRGAPGSIPFHGLMVIGWQEALDCQDAIFQGSNYQNSFRIWTVNQFAETYIPGNPTTALNGTTIANPVPWVVDFTSPPVYNDGIIETQNPVPRPFYCTMYFDFQRGGAANQIAGVDRFYEHDWQFFTLPNTVALSPNQLYVDPAWGW